MKDTRFVLQLSILLSLIAGALYVLNFVSFSKKEIPKTKDSEHFLVKLSQIESGFEFVEFKKFIKPEKVKVVVVEKEVVKEVKVPVIAEAKDVVRDSINRSIAPAKESFINISSAKIDKKKVAKKRKKTDMFTTLKREFQKTHDYKLALKISRLYYTSKKYKNSLKWAMIANELNEKDDGSWILFAKTKLKLGDRKNAQKALLTYESVYSSKRVQELLGRISS